MKNQALLSLKNNEKIFMNVVMIGALRVMVHPYTVHTLLLF